MQSLLNKTLLQAILCLFVLGTIFFEGIDGRPSLHRRKRDIETNDDSELDEVQNNDLYKREIGQQQPYDDDSEFDEDQDNDLDKREVGQRQQQQSSYYYTTFPTFPEYEGDTEDFYPRTDAPRKEPPFLIPTTEEYSYEETTTAKPLHRRVGSWFKRQWGKVSNFAKQHYNNLTS